MLQGKTESKRNVLQRMKICILNSVHPIYDTRLRRVAETLSEAGHEITVLAPSSGEGDQGGFEERFNISFIGIQRAAQGRFEKGRSLGGILKTIFSRVMIAADLFRLGLKTRADVYHCNEMDSWVVGILLKLLLKRGVVFDVHEYYPARVAETALSPQLGKWVERMVRNSFSFFSRLSDGLVFVNDSIASLYKFRCPYIVLRNCVRIRDFRPLPVVENLQKTFQDRTIVVHIGNLRVGYGAKALLESLQYIQDPAILFLILGGAYEGFLRGVEESGYTEQVKVVKQMPLEEMLDYLSLAEIGITLLQPSDKNMIYSLGRKFLEYIAAGIPVIVSDFPEYRTLVDKYELGLVVNPENPQDRAEAIIKLVEDDRLRRQLGENAARAFEVELNWEMESRKLFDLYDQLKIEN